ncbi:5742_t:CDS:1, partial [Cetraspora pellucida]
FHLRAPKILRNLSSSNEDIFSTQLNNFTLQNNSYQSSSWQYEEEQFDCNNLGINKDFNNLQFEYNESNDNYLNSLSWDDIQYENESCDADLEGQDVDNET